MTAIRSRLYFPWVCAAGSMLKAKWKLAKSIEIVGHFYTRDVSLKTKPFLRETDLSITRCSAPFFFFLHFFPPNFLRMTTLQLWATAIQAAACFLLYKNSQSPEKAGRGATARRPAAHRNGICWSSYQRPVLWASQGPSSRTSLKPLNPQQANPLLCCRKNRAHLEPAAPFLDFARRRDYPWQAQPSWREPLALHGLSPILPAAQEWETLFYSFSAQEKKKKRPPVRHCF